MNKEEIIIDEVNGRFGRSIGNDLLYYPPINRASDELNARRYYRLSREFTDEDYLYPKMEWVNRSEIDKVYRSSYGFGQEPGDPPEDAPVIQGAFRRLHDSWIWPDAYDSTKISLISERLKRIFDEVDPKGFRYLKVDADYSSFPEPGPRYWLAQVNRQLDCVDEERSVIGFFKSALPEKLYGNLADVRMESSKVGDAHVFTLKYAKYDRIIDDVLKSALEASNIRGFSFEPVQKA